MQSHFNTFREKKWKTIEMQSYSLAVTSFGIYTLGTSREFELKRREKQMIRARSNKRCGSTPGDRECRMGNCVDYWLVKRMRKDIRISESAFHVRVNGWNSPNNSSQTKQIIYIFFKLSKQFRMHLATGCGWDGGFAFVPTFMLLFIFQFQWKYFIGEIRQIVITRHIIIIIYFQLLFFILLILVLPTLMRRPI